MGQQKEGAKNVNELNFSFEKGRVHKGRPGGGVLPKI